MQDLSEVGSYPGDRKYWTIRYRSKQGRGAGDGSYGRLQAQKVYMINKWAFEHEAYSFIDLGCGDANYLDMLTFYRYQGFDLAPGAVWKAYMNHGARHDAYFSIYHPGMFERLGAHGDLALSLDVLMHITDNDLYEQYLKDLFCASDRFVLIYAPSLRQIIELGVNPVDTPPHIKYRDWQEDIPDSWSQIDYEPNMYASYAPGWEQEGRSVCDFYLYAKKVKLVV